jgi:hypothetical protein
MDKHDLSLEKACQAGDTDLIQLALLVLQKNLDQTDFYTLLRYRFPPIPLSPPPFLPSLLI